MDKLKKTGPGNTYELADHPDFLESGVSTQTIDIDQLFTKDTTNTGSFDFRSIRNITFGKLLEAMPIPTLVIDDTHVVIFANEAAEKMGDAADAAKMQGVHFASLFANSNERQRGVRVLNQVFGTRKAHIFEGMITRHRQSLWCRISFRSIRFRNNRSVLAMIEDLSAEKKQLIIHEKYQQLVQVFPIGIAEFALTNPVRTNAAVDGVLDRVYQARCVGGNLQFAKFQGKNDIEAVKGSSLGALFPAGAQHRQLYSFWIINGYPIRFFETKEAAENGKPLFFENTMVANIKNDHLMGFWVMRQDITGRKQIEEALRAARHKLEEKVKDRTHELEIINQKLRKEILERQRAETELAELVEELREALAKVKTLSGLLPICSSCKKIRDDRGYWHKVEEFVRDHSEASFTHSICPECAAALYPDYYST